MYEINFSFFFNSLNHLKLKLSMFYRFLLDYIKIIEPNKNRNKNYKLNNSSRLRLVYKS